MKEIKTEDLIRYENDEMTTAEEIVFFQKLIDTGMEGHYGRMAEAFIKEGLCRPKKEETGGEHSV